jgi:hypothetical protein
MKCLFMLLLFSGLALAEQRFDFELFINDVPTAWKVEGARQVTDGFVVEERPDKLLIHFEGGSLMLNVADYGSFDEAHVLAASLHKQTDSTTFTVTVRHRDEGWDHYADAFEITGERVNNGLRVLLHPHDSEQPFTRSQSHVQAAGLITISAHDNVHGAGGSSISLDLDHPTLDTERYSIRFELEARN